LCGSYPTDHSIGARLGVDLYIFCHIILFTTRAIGALYAANLIKLRTHPDYVASGTRLEAALFVAPSGARSTHITF
jgi:hypothetical protein